MSKKNEVIRKYKAKFSYLILSKKSNLMALLSGGHCAHHFFLRES